MSKKMPWYKPLTQDEKWEIGEHWAKRIQASGLREKYKYAMDLYYDSGDTESGFNPSRISYALDVASKVIDFGELDEFFVKRGITDYYEQENNIISIAAAANSF